MSENPLFSEFKELSKDDWLKKAEKDLRGRPLHELSSNWYGIEIDPYYSIEDRQKLPSILPIDAPGSWINYVEVAVEDVAAANKTALHQLQLGATGILFKLKEKVNYNTLLAGIHLQDCAIAFTGTGNLEDYFKHLKSLDINNPAGFIHSSTTTSSKLGTEFYPTLMAGENTNEVQELVEILQVLHKIMESNSEQEAENVIDNIAYQVLITPNYFFGIAKVRALRQLLSSFYQAYNLSFAPANFYIIARSPAWEKDEYQPHENMLKATTAAMSAISGGCNALIISPGYIDEQEELVARNISSLLEFESYLGKVADPAAGSYFIEQLTHNIITEVWSQFKSTIAT